MWLEVLDLIFRLSSAHLGLNGTGSERKLETPSMIPHRRRSKLRVEHKMHEPGFSCALVDVIKSSEGCDVSVYVVVADNIHRGTYHILGMMQCPR